MEKLIAKGAEADIYLGRWGGMNAVFKVRNRKPFLIPELDAKTRRFRTAREALILNRAKELGVPTPNIYHVSLRRFTIVMKYIGGRRLKEVIGDRPEEAKILGFYLGRLHIGKIAHGDPTTANLLYDNDDGRYIMIDFGLAQKTDEIEDFAVDVHLVKEMLSSIHHEVYNEAFSSFKSGYLKIAGQGFFERVMKRVENIERRGRYARTGR